MVDIHCHILPDIDDGASGMDEALEMAKMAYRSGVTDVIATPHFAGTEENLLQMERINRRYEQIVQALKDCGIPLKIHRGAEILCLPQTPKLAKERKLPTLAGTDYVLVEFYFDESFEYMDASLEQISNCGYRVVVAHPERYEAIQYRPYLLDRWVHRGYVIQLNKGSVLGKFGERASRAADAVLSMGFAHLFASDAHSCYQRTPHMEGIRQWAEKACTERCAHILLEDNPKRLLNGQKMVEML